MPSLGKQRVGILHITSRASAMALVITLIIVGAQSAQAQTFNVLHTFSGGIDGAIPEAGLTLDRAGNLYGTAAYGAHQFGSVFKLTHSNGSWTYTDLYDFTGGNDGGYPYGVVAVDRAAISTARRRTSAPMVMELFGRSRHKGRSRRD